LYHWDPVDPATYVTGAAKHFSGPIFAGADLQRYCLDASSTTRQSGRPPLHVCN
jgi:hypothetical protein